MRCACGVVLDTRARTWHVATIPRKPLRDLLEAEHAWEHAWGVYLAERGA